MMQPTSNVPHAPGSGHVLARFLVRLIILVGFSAFSPQGLGKTLPALLALAEVFCVTMAAFRREAPLGRVLTHWDEAAAYGLVSILMMRLA
jgi:LDH2 family malate/lactate/ureidoglycolate dehydrogenase